MIKNDDNNNDNIGTIFIKGELPMWRGNKRPRFRSNIKPIKRLAEVACLRKGGLPCASMRTGRLPNKIAWID